MNPNRRAWTLGGVAALLALAYVAVFTDWTSPQPIEIASQIRPVIQPPGSVAEGHGHPTRRPTNPPTGPPSPRPPPAWPA